MFTAMLDLKRQFLILWAFLQKHVPNPDLPPEFHSETPKGLNRIFIEKIPGELGKRVYATFPRYEKSRITTTEVVLSDELSPFLDSLIVVRQS
jgi:hypothetical protein